MRITESRLRSIIRSVISESMSRNTYLDGWLRDSAADKCTDILDVECEYRSSDNDTAGIVIPSDNDKNVLVLSGNRINISSDLDEDEIKKIVKYLEKCSILKNSKICDGVFYSPKNGNTRQII